MGNIIIAVLVLFIIFAVIGSYGHLKGKGGCCGGRSRKPAKKKLHGAGIAKKIITIEGMHCKNCKSSVENQLNQIDGAVAKVDLKRNIAIVSMERMIPDMLLKYEIEKLGYQVTDIELKEV